MIAGLPSGLRVCRVMAGNAPPGARRRYARLRVQ